MIAVAVSAVDFGVWSIGILVFFGAAFGTLGATLLTSRRLPAWYGWIPIVGGLGSTVAAIIQVAVGGEVQAAETTFLVSSLLLTGWAFAIGLRMW